MKKTAYLTLCLLDVALGASRLKKDAGGPVPSPAQLEWQQMEYNMFVHFGPNTFSGLEWGKGTEAEDLFNPSGLDCRQWAATAKAAGMKGIIFTAKHHDGFCLWPSKTSTHTVAQSSWRDGKGDVLAEISEACREYGLKFGVYISPWDRNHPAYGTPEYNNVYVQAIEEVHSNYGPMFEHWFDGARIRKRHGGKVWEITLPEYRSFDYVQLQEDIRLGQRISSFRVDIQDFDVALDNGGWLPIAEGTTVGYKRIIPTGPRMAKRLRVEITGSHSRPILQSISLFHQ